MKKRVLKWNGQDGQVLETRCGFSRTDFENKTKAWVCLDGHLCRLRNDFMLNCLEEELVVCFDGSLNYFEMVPKRLGEIGHSLRVCDLSLNQIDRVDHHEGMRLPELRVLNLARNRIERVGLNGFQDLEKLVTLDLSGNRLCDLRRESFAPLVSLRELNLKGNLLKVVIGLDPLKQLETLNLAQNQLTDVLQLARNEKLKVLDLAYNELDDLEEIRDVVLTLSELVELKVMENPIAKDPFYKLKLLENENITKLDCHRVSQVSRKKWMETKMNHDLDDIVEQTTMHYMRWIEAQAVQKQKMISILRRREEAIENAFMQYKRSMEAELEQCIAYIQDNGIKDGGNCNDWKHELEKAEQMRQEAYAEQVTKMEQVLEDVVAFKSETDGYLYKLRTLAENRPAIWREIKQKEMDHRAREEDEQDLDKQNFLQQRQEARKRLAQRAEQRNKLLLQAAAQLEMKI